jgi:hypothetical protein
MIMQQLVRVTVAVAMLAAILPAAAETATVTRAWQFKPESAQGLEVRNLIGNIRVERGAGPGAHVTAIATIDAKSKTEAERLLDLIEYRTADVGAGSRFDVFLAREHFPKIYWSGGSSMWWGISYTEHLGERIRLSGDRDEAPAVRVDLVIRAPAGARLSVDNHLGEMVANAYSGELRLDGASGLLRSTNGEGRLELDSGSGAVEVVAHRGRVDADTGSGKVTITDCECEISADTGSGAVEIRGGAGEASADTGSGRVTIDDFAGSIEADTGSGSVRARAIKDVRRLDVDTGSGGVEVDGDLSALERLRIDTGSGSVRLRSSTMPSMEIRINTGSGGVHVDAPGATVREAEDVWTVRTGDGAGTGLIDTGSGGVDITFP